jgi:hypothetical protein
MLDPSFANCSYQPGPDIEWKTSFWLVWDKYIPDIEINIKLVQGWYYLRYLLGEY